LPSDDWRPSRQLADLLSGKLAWGDASPAVESWARLHIYQGACSVLDLPTKGERRNALGKIPASVRPHVEAEAMRIHKIRMQKPK